MIGNIISGILAPITPNLSVDYLVVAGGGSGGNYSGGGGGAGGARCTIDQTGGLGTLETPLTLSFSTNYSIKVGAGGATATEGVMRNDGSTSIFSTITATGGGAGGGFGEPPVSDGNTGGSGGGAGIYAGGAIGTRTASPVQGFNGGTCTSTTGYLANGGGGGAGAVGVNATTSAAGNGGSGIVTTISGSTTTYAAGGGGSRYTNTGITPGSGGSGIGGNAGNGSTAGSAGTINTGSGGGGGSPVPTTAYKNGGAGGSGIVILKYPSNYTATFSGGVTQSTTTSGLYKISTITAAGVSDTVSWA